MRDPIKVLIRGRELLDSWGPTPITDAMLSESRQASVTQSCATDRESWACLNMKPIEDDSDMQYEHYECKVCGRTMKLDYEEIK